MSKSVYFTSIDDFMLDRWWKCIDGDLKFTRIDLNDGNEKSDFDAWCKINDSYINEFGLSKELEEITELRMRIANLECDFIIENDQFLRNEIRRLTNELLDIIKKATDGEGLNRNGLMVQLEKWMGFGLPETTTTTKKFYSIVREFEKEQEHIKKANA